MKIAKLSLLLLALSSLTTTVYADTNPVDKLANDATSLVKDTANIIQDGTITVAINTKIALDKNLSNYNVDVTTRNGIVTLTGQVNSDTEVKEIIHMAEATEGVKSVNSSNLTVKKSNQLISDMAITTKIKALFLKEKILSESDVPATSIGVETTNGIVYLSGTAESATQVKNAKSLAASVDGVSRVESNVIIKDK